MSGRTPGRLVAADDPVIDLWVDMYPHLAPLAVRARAGNGAAINGLVNQIATLTGPFTAGRTTPEIEAQWRRLISVGARDAVPVGPIEIAGMLGVERGTVDKWGQRGILPEPRWTVSGRPLWAQQDILTWAAETGRLPTKNGTRT